MSTQGKLTSDGEQYTSIDEWDTEEYTSNSTPVAEMPTAEFEQTLRQAEQEKEAAEKTMSMQLDGADLPRWTDNETQSYILPTTPIVDGKVGGKLPVEQYNRLRKFSIWNSYARSATLGRYTTGEDSYIKRAGNTSAYFDMGDAVWRQVQKNYGLTREEMFELFNKPFLQSAVENGLSIQFSHDPTQSEGFFLEKEWEYIKEALYLTDADLQYNGGMWYVG